MKLIVWSILILSTIQTGFTQSCELLLSEEFKKLKIGTFDQPQVSKTIQMQDLKEYTFKKKDIEQIEDDEQASNELSNLNKEFQMNDVRYRFIIWKKYYNKIISFESTADAYYFDSKMLAYSIHYPEYEKLISLSDDCRIEKISIWKKNRLREKLNLTPGLCKDLPSMQSTAAAIKDDFIPRCFEVGGIPMENRNPVVCKCPTFSYIDPWFETCSATDRVFKKRSKHRLEDFVLDRGSLWDNYNEMNFKFALELCNEHKKELFINLGK